MYVVSCVSEALMKDRDCPLPIRLKQGYQWKLFLLPRVGLGFPGLTIKKNTRTHFHIL